ncbi:hypothetical protein [Pyxidicoccus trucidator]|uniref:hypothetical protein n=1 Tax=Pyxidicoccus trucidator TaxID=2709662 RepID=UPI0013DD21D3|nr:hypothetical protein [Pyxidicoccus trucidator]
MADFRTDTVELRLGRVERTAEALQVEASLRNTGPAVVWVFDRLFHTEPSGHYRLDASLAYVEEQGGVLVLSRKLHPVPAGLMVEFPEVPCVSRLAPGASREQFIRVAFPAKTWVPYSQGVRRAVSADSIRSVRLQWGFFPDVEGLHFYRGRDVAGQDFQYPAYGPALAAQRLVDTGPREL